MQEDSNSVANTKIMHGQLSHLTSALGASLTAHAEQLQACMEVCGAHPLPLAARHSPPPPFPCRHTGH